jgi:(2Fe-2S) ferredoxin
VYPEGIWYAGVTPELLARIVREHLKDGHPVREAVFHRMMPAE